jgi:proteasome lid subunit RPN8/RPN11
MIQQLNLSKQQWDEMQRHVAEQVPLEACGLLAGRDNKVERVIMVRNQAQSPARFVMEPYEQLRAFEWIESNNLDLLGIFHSHPAGPDIVSATDIEEAAYEVVYIIWSQNKDQWTARGFWVEHGQATDVALQIMNR